MLLERINWKKNLQPIELVFANAKLRSNLKISNFFENSEEEKVSKN